MTDRSLPENVYLDTSIVVAAILEGLAHSEASAAICARLGQNRSRVLYSQVLRLELSQALIKLPHDAQLPWELRQRFRLDRWGSNARIRREWMEFGIQQFDSLTAQFSEVLELPFDVPTWETSVDIMAQTQLQSLDAIHVATARRAGVQDLATLDHHFNRLTGMRVWLIR